MKFYDTEEQLHFMEACSKGDRLEAEKLLRSGEIDVNFQHGINKWTALHWAAKRGYENLCTILLKAGFSPEARDSQDRTPFDVCDAENNSLRSLLSSVKNDEEEEMHDDVPCEVNGNKFTPGYIKYPNFPYSKQASLDSGSNPSSPTTRGYYSYGRRDSATRTRFLLVRTSCSAGKEAFKRITLPGGSTVEELRRTVENAMKQGYVQSLLTLPDNVLIEDESQIEAFGNCQKIDVIFGEPLPQDVSSSPSKISTSVRRPSLQSNKMSSGPETPENSISQITHSITREADTFALQPAPASVSKSEEVLVTPPPSPSSEADVPDEKEVEPLVEDPVQVTADLYFQKEAQPSDVLKTVPIPVVDKEDQDILAQSKKWTTAQQVAAVAAAASLVGLGCYIYKLRK